VKLKQVFLRVLVAVIATSPFFLMVGGFRDYPPVPVVHAQEEELPRHAVQAAEEIECSDAAGDRLETSCFFDADYGGCMTKALEFVRLWPQAGNARVEMFIQAHCKLGLGENCGQNERDHAHITLCFIE
jgi:hypothetical protein